jgi:hypothetical protein
MNNYVIYVLMFAIVLFFSYIGSRTKEPFVPHIRKMYRPYMRNARVMSEGFHSQTKTKIESFVRRFGLV